ncbi:hypothetical protein SCUP234_00545 [Seiridium cupressi]
MADEEYPTIKVEQPATNVPLWPSIEHDVPIKSPRSDSGLSKGGDTPTSIFTSPSPSAASESADLVAGLPHAVTLAAPAKFRGQHPPGLWETLKQEIRHMYIDEELPLKEVREIMMQKGFVATEKMYKDKFAKWGFNKNNRKKDVAKIVSHQKQRKVAGKSTVYYRNGKVVNIESYIKRAKLSPEDLLEAVEEENLPSYVRSRTPAPASDPKPEYFQPLGYYNVRDLLFKCFRHLGARADAVLDQDTAISAFADYPKTDFYRTVRNLRDAAWLFEEGRTKEGGVLVRRAFDHLHMLVEDPSPWALCDLLMYQMAVIQYGHQTLIWKFLSDYSSTGRGPLEWLRSVFQALHDFFQSYPIETCLDFLAEQVGVIYPLMMVRDTPRNMQSFLQGVVNSKSRHHYHIQPVRRFTLAIESQSFPRLKSVLDSDNALFRFHELFTIGLETGWRNSRCLDLATELYKAETDINSRRLSLRALAYYHMGQCRPDSAEAAATNPRYGYAKQYMQQALELAPHASFGGMSGGALREIWEDSKLLEQWHLEDGDTSAADSLVQNRVDALSQFVASLDINVSPAASPVPSPAYSSAPSPGLI